MTTKKTEEIPEGYKFYCRKFLNTPGMNSTAFIYATVDTEGYAELTISDCSRQISLELDNFYHDGSAERVKNSVNKLDTLIETLKGLRAAYVAACKQRGWKPGKVNKEA